MRSLTSCVLLGLAACAGSPNTIDITLSPSVISSLDGTTTVAALVASDTTPLAHVAIHATVDYTDRNGTPHVIAPLDGKTDARGVFTTTISGLTWDGTGTVTVSYGSALSGSATFSVLDRTPPTVKILPPTTDNHVGPGLPLDVQVHVTDEIGVSDVVLDDAGGITAARQSVIASGAQDTTVTFRLDIPQDAAAGSTIELHALATDLSGNIASAQAVDLLVDPTITIATPPGLSGTLIADGTQQQLANPTAIVASPKDGHLYVADDAGTGACSPSCVWRVDAATGAIDSTPVYVGQGTTEGVALDATGDHLYVSDRQDRVAQLTWNGTAYASPVLCDDTAQQQPQDPFHLVVDPTLGILVVDGNAKQVERLATCATTTVGQAVSMNGNFDGPRGIALDPSGAIYVSDTNRDRVSLVDRTTGAVTPFGSGLNAPYGLEWLAGGTSSFADSLLVADSGDRIIASTKGTNALAVTYLRNSPIDLALLAGTLYIVTSPSAGNRGRIYAVTGF